MLCIQSPSNSTWTSQSWDMVEQKWRPIHDEGLFMYDKYMDIFNGYNKDKCWFYSYACVKNDKSDKVNRDEPFFAQYMYFKDEKLILETVHLPSQKNRITVYRKDEIKK